MRASVCERVCASERCVRALVHGYDEEAIMHGSCKYIVTLYNNTKGQSCRFSIIYLSACPKQIRYNESKMHQQIWYSHVNNRLFI